MRRMQVRTSPPPRPKPGTDLVEWLQSNFPDRCIRADEDPILAHRYAAKVELANQLIRMAKVSDELDGLSHQED